MIPPNFQTISKLGCRRIPLNDGSGLEVIVPRLELAAQIAAVGERLRYDYHGLELTTIPVLEGGAWITGRITSNLPDASRHRTVSLVANRYKTQIQQGGTKVFVPGEVKVYHDWIAENPQVQAKIRGRHCLILDDVLDRGDTAVKVIEVISKYGPASIKTLFMVRKEVRRTVTVSADYVLFDVDNKWLIGAGLDDDGEGRDRQYIACKP